MLRRNVNFPTSTSVNSLPGASQGHYHYRVVNLFFWSCTKLHRSVEHTSVKGLNKFVWYTLNAFRQGDENPISSAVAKTMNLLANSSHGHLFIDCSHHSLTRYKNDEKTRAAINSKWFNLLIHINNQRAGASQIWYRSWKINQCRLLCPAVGRLRMVEHFYNLKKFPFWQVPEDGTGYRFAVFSTSRKNLYSCIRSEKKQEWDSLRSKDCNDLLTADACSISFLKRAVLNTKKT